MRSAGCLSTEVGPAIVHCRLVYIQHIPSGLRFKKNWNWIFFRCFLKYSLHRLVILRTLVLITIECQMSWIFSGKCPWPLIARPHVDCHTLEKDTLSLESQFYNHVQSLKVKNSGAGHWTLSKQMSDHSKNFQNLVFRTHTTPFWPMEQSSILCDKFDCAQGPWNFLPLLATVHDFESDLLIEVFDCSSS